MANVTSQGIYSPLPQSLSDSDSEKELQMDSLRPSYSHRHTQNGSMHKHATNIAYNNACPLPNRLDIKTKPGFRGMSTIRKCLFIFSILLCFFTIFIFLWVLPCNEGTCPVKILSWDRRHEDIELQGKINVVQGVFSHNHNLALLFKHNIHSGEGQNGAISMLGNNGGVAWYIPQSKTPMDLNCYVIDVNADKVTDCLIFGELGLKAVDPVSGEILWHVRKSGDNKPVRNFDFPIVISDVNNDGIKDLISIARDNITHNTGIIISGRTGIIMASFSLNHCEYSKGESAIGNNYIYLCRNSSKENYYEISANTLKNLLLNNSTKIESVNVQYKQDCKYSVSGRQLMVENKGKCPDCATNVTLTDEKTGKQILNWYHLNSYTMNPTSFSFKSTEANLSLLKGHVNGFILKLWQWSGYNKGIPKAIAKRNVPVSNMTTNTITERIILVTFNDTNFHIINASSNEITQLCFLSEGGETSCQPDMENQTDSILITDLDNDGSQELISYSTTYEHRPADNKWHLVSNMKLIRLEAELPQLYEAAK